ncbi:MAG TPA: hypothetical protein VK856_10085 [Anaerolineaceae bacterium]|nr:hypothetical protein [Anaerolineaceae bacterium]
MSEENISTSNQSISLSSLGWDDNLVCVVCQHCDWRYLAKPGSITRECPHCHTQNLENEGDDFSMMVDFIRPPELYLPFSLKSTILQEKMQIFAKSIQFAPDDLQLGNLQQRLKRVYLPMWLVDSKVSASWQADCGYYYQAKSHQEKYSGGRWQTQEVIETRTRWEPRVGKLERGYQNIAAPALEEHRKLMQALGNFSFNQAKNITPAGILSDSSGAVMVCIPTRDKDDAWPDTLPRFQEQATHETKQACAADQIREFRWSPAFSNQNWTLFLLPMWISYYLDDESKPQSILINGQSGQLSGVKRASMKKAKKVALTILVVAALLLGLSIVIGLISMMVPGLVVLATIGLVLSFGVALGATYPLISVWSTNKK